MDRVIVIGGGAAGLMAAGTAARENREAEVLLVERNGLLGKKLLLTGKGRCNVTSACDDAEFFDQIVTNSRFLRSSYSAFTCRDAWSFFENQGVPLKVERGNRVFPVSDRSADIVFALRRYAAEAGVRIQTGRAEKLETADGRISAVLLRDGRRLPADRVVLCTGGLSYQATGSTGDGYRMARELGHTIISPQPSLVPMEAEGQDCRRMQGLSLRNVALKLYDRESGKVVFSDFGELLFTHFGLSGPLVLSASCHMKDREKRDRYEVSLDLKPALSEQQLDLRLLRDFEKNSNREFANSLGELLPRKMIEIVVERCGIPPERKVHQISREQRAALREVLKDFRVVIRGLRPVEEAIITSGGVKTAEVNPKTMESKLVEGLYFAGEVLDLDAYTGGFNLQIAFTTGRAAGAAAAHGRERG